MAVYADLVLLTNFCIDTTVLMVTAKSQKLKVSKGRVVLAAVIGSSYAMLMLVPAMAFLFTFVIKCLFSLLMIYTAFGFGSLQHFLKNLGTFYLINFVAAGGILGLHYMFQSSGEVMNGILFTRTGGTAYALRVGYLFIILTFIGMILFYQRVWRSAKRRENLTDCFVEVQVLIGEHVSLCTGLIDTGNRLYDPLTRTPVMVLEAAKFDRVLPEAWMRCIRLAKVEDIVTGSSEEEFKWQDRVRLVPFRGINRGMQLMLALKPDKVVIKRGGTNIETGKVLIGLDGGKLCADGSYQAIVHPMLLEADSS